MHKEQTYLPCIILLNKVLVEGNDVKVEVATEQETKMILLERISLERKMGFIPYLLCV